MARQLRAHGLEVGLVSLLDTYNIVEDEGLANSVKAAYKRIRLHLERLSSKRLREWPSYLAGRVVAIGRRGEKIAWRRLYLTYLSLAGRKKAKADTEPGASKPSPFQDLLRVYQAMGFAYKPKPYEGRVVLFRATHAPKEGTYGPHDLGWSTLTAGGLDIIMIPGDHHSMLQEPNIAVLAEEMSRWLTRYEQGRVGVGSAADDLWPTGSVSAK
jgi:thioesterase domain-containing protein